MGKRMFARLGVAAAAGALALALASAGPALANGHVATIDINDDHVPTTAADFADRPGQESDCSDEAFGDIESGEDGWHFILPDHSGDDFVELRLTFSTPDGAVTVTIDQVDPPGSSDPVEGWRGAHITAAGQSGMFIHAWLITPEGWTLEDAEADVTGDASGPGGKDPFFNLSHVCLGDEEPGNGNGTPTPTTTPTTTTTPGDGNGGGGDEPELPVTGMQVGGLALLGAGLLAGGIAMMAVRRRRSLASLLDEG